MALITPQGKLTVSPPATDGLITVQPYQRDWFCNAKWEGGGEWIEPLNAIGPAGDMRPVSMASLFAVNASYNQNIRSVTVPGNPATVGAEFYDGAVYAAGTAVGTYVGVLNTNLLTDYWQPNIILRLTRYAPPPAQGVVPQTTLSLVGQVRVTASDGVYYLDRNGTWTAATIILRLPFQSEAYKKAQLAWYLGTWGPLSATSVFAEKDSSQAIDGGEQREAIAFETVQDATMFDGAHFLIRSSLAGDWWHTYNENIRMTTGPVRIGMAGCRQVVQCSKITYSSSTPDDVTCWAQSPKPLPSAEYETTVNYDALYSLDADNDWTVTAANKDDATVQALLGYRPEVTFSPSIAEDSKRPILWMVAEEHEATIAVPDGLAAATDTEGDKALRDLTLRVNDQWRGASGSATFYRDSAARYTDWLEGGKAVLNLGWQTGAGTGLAATDLATMYIAPGGIVRDRDGGELSGLPGLSVEFVDGIAAKLAETCVVDFGQAAGFALGTWFASAMHHLGIPDSCIEIATEVASLVIPTASPLPSVPNLKPQDGDDWASHLDAVCAATNTRWGYNPYTGKFFIGTRRPLYVAGTSTISLTIDYDTLTVEDTIYKLKHERNSAGYRNRFKILYGSESARRASYWKATSDAERLAAGGDKWAVADTTDTQTITDILAELSEAHRTVSDLIEWEGPLRIGLRPEQFVAIGDCPEVALTVGDVYQIAEVSHSTSARRTTIIARRVYDATAAAALQGGANTNAANTETLNI